MKSADNYGIQWQNRPVRLASKQRTAELKTLLKKLRLQIEHAPKIHDSTMKNDKKEQVLTPNKLN